MTSDVEFFFDPVCPWAWITSRWVEEVAAGSDLSVTWRFISLRLLNADKDYATHFPPGYTEGHTLGLRLLRMAAAARETGGNEAVGRLYAELGQRIHRPGAGLMEMAAGGTEKAVAAAGLPAELAAAQDDERFDALLAEETQLALDRAGPDVGTPVLTFGPPDGPSFFGPVISRVPRGEDAVALWEATERLARFPGFAELKRALREPPQFPR
jgi:2-hydroxychromene-2-carboxylate isomerase